MKKKKKPAAPPEPPNPPRRRRKVGTFSASSDPDERLQRVAAVCKLVYTQERSAFESLRSGERVEYRPPSRYDGTKDEKTDDGVVVTEGQPSVWLKIAKECVKRRIDARLYIVAQFDRADHMGVPPAPTHLFGPRAQALWNRAKHKKEGEIELALTIQRNIAVSRITIVQRAAGRSPEDSYVITLLDTGLELSALFRYCLASSLKGKVFRRIARRFEVAACVQFERYRLYYKRHWKEMLPKGFSARSRAIYKFLFEARVRNDKAEEDE